VPDYAVPGVGNERVATGLAGFAGVLGVFAIGYGVAVVARRRPLPA
jgi:cobalt/nickel transport protein